jgi:acyl-homoserine-lactone acylase
MVLQGKKDFTLDGLLAAAYDTQLPWFTEPIAALRAAHEADANLERKRRIAEAVGVLTGWDQRWSVDSVATSLGIYWGNEIRPRMRGDVKNLGREILLVSLEEAMHKLAQDFGKWQTPWGQINRFQRLSGAIAPHFDDAKPSLPVGFPSGNWGSLASFGARPYPKTKRWYGSSGNSFVAVVEFGPKLKARAISAGGESGDIASKHFNDQAERYAEGNLREVYFYKEQLAGHTEKEYTVSASAK